MPGIEHDDRDNDQRDAQPVAEDFAETADLVNPIWTISAADPLRQRHIDGQRRDTQPGQYRRTGP